MGNKVIFWHYTVHILDRIVHEGTPWETIDALRLSYAPQSLSDGAGFTFLLPKRCHTYMAAVAQGLIVVMSPSKLSGVAQPVIARIENGKFPALNSVYRPLQEADARVCNGFYE